MHVRNNRAIKGKALARAIFAVFDNGTVGDMFEDYFIWCLENDTKNDISVAAWLACDE